MWHSDKVISISLHKILCFHSYAILSRYTTLLIANTELVLLVRGQSNYKELAGLYFGRFHLCFCFTWNLAYVSRFWETDRDWKTSVTEVHILRDQKLSIWYRTLKLTKSKTTLGKLNQLLPIMHEKTDLQNRCHLSNLVNPFFLFQSIFKTTYFDLKNEWWYMLSGFLHEHTTKNAKFMTSDFWPKRIKN